MSTELIEKVDGILKNSELPDRHTLFQLEKFIIGKEPTAQAQLWAIVRELQARKETLESYDKDLADTEDNLEMFDIRIERLNRKINVLKNMVPNPDIEEDANIDLNIIECEINIRKLERDKDSLIKAARKVNKKKDDLKIEMAFLAAGFEKISIKVGGMKPMDDEVAQKEMWNEKFLEEFNLRVVLQRPLDIEFIKTVLCLNDDSLVKKHVVGLINNIQSKMIEEKKSYIESQKEKTGA